MSPTTTPPRVLILGGTGFVGRHVAEAFLARGAAVTLLHRGRSNPGVLPAAEHVLAERASPEASATLAGRAFDVVVDTSGYEVPVVRASARALAASQPLYVFVSSISVYADLARTDEGAPARTTAGADTATLSLDNYGALKAACETAIDAELPGRALHVRAGLILGPHDYDARFRYWLERIARGGEVLAPGDPDAPTQAIDARDLAAWIVRSAAARTVGTFNVTGAPLSMRERLETVRAVVGGAARLSWVPDDVLLAHAVAPYSELPFWLPASLGARPVPIDRALASGLALRPFSDTARDTWTWLRTDGWDAEASVRAHRRLHVPAGLSDAREQAILGALRR